MDDLTYEFEKRKTILSEGGLAAYDISITKYI